MTTSLKTISIIGLGPFGGAMLKLFLVNNPEIQINVIDIFDEVIQTSLSKIGDLHDKNITSINSREDVKGYHSALEQSQIVVLAVGSSLTMKIIESIQKLIDPQTVLLNVSKGLMPSGMTFSQEIIHSGHHGIPVALSGGMAAHDVYAGVATGAMIGSNDGEVLQVLHTMLSSDLLHVQSTQDIIGVEYAGVLKNLLSIQCGYMHASGKNTAQISEYINHATHLIKTNAASLCIQPTTYDHTYARDHPDYGDIRTSCYGGTRNFRLGQAWFESGHLQSAISNLEAQGVTIEGAKTLKLLQTINSPLTQLPRVQSLLFAYSHD